MKMFITIIALLGSSIIYAGDSYHAPHFEMKEMKSKNHQVKFHKSWEEESQYKLKDIPESDRAVASNPDEEKVKPMDIKKRDPSSIVHKGHNHQNSLLKENMEAKVKGWDLLPSLDN